MAVTFKNKTTGQLQTCPEPDDPPVRRQRPRAQRIAQFDAADEWERVESASAVRTAPDGPSTAEVRAWAKAEGLDVPAKGKLSAEVVEAHKAAHGHDQPSAQPDA